YLLDLARTSRRAQDLCPCGTLRRFTVCCGRLLDGAEAAVTAEQLMRSRFCAFALRRSPGYLEATQASHFTADRRERNRKWMQEARVSNLRIHKIVAGTRDDNHGEVVWTFTVTLHGKTFDHGEHSLFKKHDGRWLYVEAVAPR